MCFELELADRKLGSPDKQLVFDDIPVFSLDNSPGWYKLKQLAGDHHGLTAVFLSACGASGESLTEPCICLHVPVCTVTQDPGWDLVQERGQVLIFEL